MSTPMRTLWIFGVMAVARGAGVGDPHTYRTARTEFLPWVGTLRPSPGEEVGHADDRLPPSTPFAACRPPAGAPRRASSTVPTPRRSVRGGRGVARRSAAGLGADRRADLGGAADRRHLGAGALARSAVPGPGLRPPRVRLRPERGGRR